jgi:hypothetical protein
LTGCVFDDKYTPDRKFSSGALRGEDLVFPSNGDKNHPARRRVWFTSIPTWRRANPEGGAVRSKERGCMQGLRRWDGEPPKSAQRLSLRSMVFRWRPRKALRNALSSILILVCGASFTQCGRSKHPIKTLSASKNGRTRTFAGAVSLFATRRRLSSARGRSQTHAPPPEAPRSGLEGRIQNQPSRDARFPLRFASATSAE